MLYHKALLALTTPATVDEIQAKATEMFPGQVSSNIKTIRAALSYLIKTKRAKRVSRGRYVGIKVDASMEAVMRLMAENQRLREELATLARAITIKQGHG